MFNTKLLFLLLTNIFYFSNIILFSIGQPAVQNSPQKAHKCDHAALLIGIQSVECTINIPNVTCKVICYENTNTCLKIFVTFSN